MFPIDLVYLWVDGNDKKWLKEKHKWEKFYKIKHENNQFLYRDNGELKYSIRSAEECVPWINHIYIITGFNQIPKWLNTKNKKITIVPHETIIPHNALPTFNSDTIEMCIPNIPNLSEHFILANDDTFFNKKLKPSFFFSKKGQPITRYNHHKIPHNNITEWFNKADKYTKTLILSAKQIKETFNKCVYKYKPSHGIDPYCKTSWLECANIPHINTNIKKQLSNKFRTDREYQRWIFNLYGLITKQYIFKKAHGYKSGKRPLLNFLYNSLHFYSVRQSPVFCFDAAYSKESIKHSPIFCINDSIYSTEEIHKHNLEFLQNRFPKKSKYEKQR